MSKTITSLSIGGRRLVGCKIGGGSIMHKDAMPDGLVLWYDVKRQGGTNATLRENPRLVDLSGNGFDMTLYNLNWDITPWDVYEGRLRLTGNAYGQLDEFRVLEDLTIIAKRRFTSAPDNYGTFLSTCIQAGIGWGFEAWDSFNGRFQGCVSICRALWAGVEFPELITWGTPQSYNGVPPTTPDRDRLMIGTLYLGCMRGGMGYRPVDFYSLMIFDHTLTEEEIQTVIDNYL